MSEIFTQLAKSIEKIPDDYFDDSRISEQIRHCLTYTEVLVDGVLSGSDMLDYSKRRRIKINKTEAITLAHEIQEKLNRVLKRPDRQIKVRKVPDQALTHSSLTDQIHSNLEHIHHHAAILSAWIALKKSVKALPTAEQEPALSEALSFAESIFPKNLTFSPSTPRD